MTPVVNDGTRPLDNASPSLVLFDHALNDTLFEDHNGNQLDEVGVKSGLPSNETLQQQGSNIFDTAANNNDQQHISSSSSSADIINSSSITTYIFFIFPIIGFFVLIMGYCYLRNRQVRQDAEAIQRRDERLNAAESERRLKQERRNTLVEKALITVTILPSKSLASKRGRFFGSRGRSSTMEMEDDMITLDSTNSSSGSFALGGGGLVVRRTSITSEMMSSSIEAIDELDEELSNAEEGHNNVSSNLTGDSPVDVESAEDEPCTGINSSDVVNAGTAPEWLQTDELCAICLEPYKENDDISFSKHQNCNHAFHTSCIVSWLKDEFRNDCPCCRGPYLHLCVTEDECEYTLGGGSSSSTPSNNRSTASTNERWSEPTDIAEVMDPTSFNSMATIANTDGGDEEHGIRHDVDV